MANGMLNQIIEDFSTEYLAQNSKDMQACAKSRDHFISKLKDKIKVDKYGPQLYSQEPIINFGSRFDGTQYGDVDEMDLLIVIDSNNGQYTFDGRVIGTGKGNQSPNHKYDEKFLKADKSGVSGIKLCNWLKDKASEIIEEGYKASTKPIKDGQAVTVEVKSLGLSFDLVVAGVFEHLDGHGIFYNISDGTSKNDWILTNPKADKAKMKELADSYDNFCDVIRAIKFIKDSHQIIISSHTVKSSVADFAENALLGYAWSDSFWDDLKGALNHLEKSLRNKHIPDLLVSYKTRKHENLISGLENNTICADKIQKVISGLNEIENLKEEERYSTLVSLLSNGKIKITEDRKLTLVAEVLQMHPTNSDWFLVD